MAARSSSAVLERRAVPARSKSAPKAGAGSNGVFRATEEGVRRVWKLIKDHNIQVVDLKFNDLPGLWQHFTIPIGEIDQDANKGIWVDGIGFDGSSIRGFQKIQESDMNLYPDASTATSTTRSPRRPTAATRASSPARPRRT